MESPSGWNIRVTGRVSGRETPSFPEKDQTKAYGHAEHAWDHGNHSFQGRVIPNVGGTRNSVSGSRLINPTAVTAFFPIRMPCAHQPGMGRPPARLRPIPREACPRFALLPDSPRPRERAYAIKRSTGSGCTGTISADRSRRCTSSDTKGKLRSGIGRCRRRHGRRYRVGPCRPGQGPAALPAAR